MGNALVAFQGEAKVDLENMIDLEDVARRSPIYSPSMLHFIGEFFQADLEKGIYLQHLLVSEIFEALLEKRGLELTKIGNDIYHGERKLNVSICTSTLVSSLIHIGVNIRTEGTPVPTVGLQEMGVDPLLFAQTILEKFRQNQAIRTRSLYKVRPR
jgi:hypothetical protein